MWVALLIAAGIYLFFLLMGWGFTRLILPESTRSYQFWVAPWFGLIVADISLVWFSRLGLGTNRSIYLVVVLGISLLALCKFRKVSLFIPLRRFDAVIALGSVLALFLALSPLLAINPELTTISLKNLDPIIYANTGDFLKIHSINQRPNIDIESPSTLMISAALEPGHRPGAWLIFGLISSLFHLKTYQIFTLTLGVFFALTPSLITIFTWILTKHHLAAIIALTISVFNVNSLYFNYHGFAAQVLAQGCMILVFLWLYLGERGEEPFEFYLLPFAVTLSSLFTLYPEMGAFCIVEVAFYMAFKLIQKNNNKYKLIKNFTLVFVITVLIDPLAFWQGINFVVTWSQGLAGWPMPRWASPADIVGLLSIHSEKNYSNIFFIITNSLVIGLIALGLSRLGNRSFSLSIISFVMIALGWLGIIRKFSYGYYKTTGFFTFIFIIVFSVGLFFTIYKLSFWLKNKLSNKIYIVTNYAIQFSIVSIVLFLSCTSVLPTLKAMENQQLRVTKELASIAQLNFIPRQQKINLELSSEWEQSWAMSLLPKNRINFIYIVPEFLSEFLKTQSIDNKLKLNQISTSSLLNYLSNMDNEELLLAPINKWKDQLIIDIKENIIWKNNHYALATTNLNKISVKLGENWWGLEKWKEKPLEMESQVFQWVNQDAVIYIENKTNQPLPVSIDLQLLPILSKTTVDVYLNNQVIKSLKIEPGLDLYEFNCKLSPGKNKIMLHTKEGTLTPIGDTRKIALGVNGIFSTLAPTFHNNQNLKVNATSTIVVNKQFAQEIKILEPLKSTKAGTKIEIPILVKNTSNFVWEPKSSNPVNFGYNWSDLNGKIVVLNGERTALPTRLPPKRSMRLNAVVKLPSTPGKYILTLTMVQEYIGWFNQNGAQSPQIPVTVIP